MSFLVAGFGVEDPAQEFDAGEIVVASRGGRELIPQSLDVCGGMERGEGRKKCDGREKTNSRRRHKCSLSEAGELSAKIRRDFNKHRPIPSHPERRPSGPESLRNF